MLRISAWHISLVAFVIAFVAATAPIVNAAPLDNSAFQDKTYPDLDSTDPEVRAAAVQAIHAARDSAGVPALLAHIDDPDQRVGLYISQALIDLGSAQTLVRLRVILWNGTANARWRAAYVLGERMDIRSIPALARALRDEEVLVSRYAGEALGKIDGTGGIAALIRSLTSPRRSEVHAARAALLALGNEAVPLLERALESSDPAMEQNAAIVLEAIGTREAQAALQQTDHR